MARAPMPAVSGNGNPADQCLRKTGPLPECDYFLSIKGSGVAEPDGPPLYAKAGWGIQQLPAGRAQSVFGVSNVE